MKKLYLIDALSIIYKSHFAFINNPLKNSKNQNISAIYGFLSSLLSIIERDKPDYLIVAFDSKEKTFRTELYDLYKANRPVMPDEMIYQVGRIKEILEALNIKIIIQPGYEADDLIGTVAKKISNNNIQSFLVTPDKDYLQLLDENIFILRPGKKSSEQGELISKNDINSILGIDPKYILDYFALVGDASDNVPGVKGIGDKTAQDLIRKYGDIDNLYQSIEKIEKPGVKNKLIEGKDSAYLSKTLVKIKTDIEIELDLNDTTLGSPKLQRVFDILKDLEIKAFNKKIESIFSNSLFSDTENLEPINNPETIDPKKESFKKEKVRYELVNSKNAIENLVGLLNTSKEFVFDTETDDLDVINANLLGISFALKEEEAYFIPYHILNEKDKIYVIDELKILMSNSGIKKIGQNLKYDINILRNHGIEVEGEIFDTMIASYILNPDEKHNLDDLVLKYFNYQKIKYEEVLGDKNNPLLIKEYDFNSLSNYSCEDADFEFRLYKLLEKELIKNDLLELCEKIEFPLIKVLAKMEYGGVYVDIQELKIQSVEINKMLIELEKKIHDYAGLKFNLNSPKQLQEILFTRLKLNPTKKTATGYSTDVQTLESLLNEHPIIELLIENRQLSKLQSTYIDSLPKLVNKKTGRIHTSYNQAVASTGRLSSSNPNLQNIPIRTELGREIRKAFATPNDKYVILSVDYSQIELRIMAHICKDENMIKAFFNNVDIHANTASVIYNCSLDQVTSDMRRKAKEVNFGIIYGIGPHGLKTRLGIQQSQAKEIIDNYFKNFPKIKQYLTYTIDFAREKGYVETIFKRRRYLPNINSKNFTLRSFEERAAINMPIQGTASDIIKIAMINISNEFKKLKLESKMIMQVHDELIFEVAVNELDSIKKMIKEKMESAVILSVPIKVDIGTGKNWLDAH